MHVKFNIGLTDLLAVWGAFVATLVLLWDIFKWKKTGPQIIFTALPNMCMYGDPNISKDKTFISTKAANKGDHPTTITNLGIRYYSNYICRLFRKPNWQGVIANPLPGRLPHKLEPGEVWCGLIDQDELKDEV